MNSASGLGKDRSVTFTYETSEQGVRRVLQSMRAWLATMGLDEDFCGTAEITLAEVMNNVAEHAYHGEARDTALLKLRLTPEGCEFDLTDQGEPMPGLSLPTGQLPTLVGPRAELPEGGFGWFLIRTLSDRLTYTRENGANHVHIRLPFTHG
ncbi:ATP-binding protein [Roseovarius sp. LXJ103]|uniref:ATP-binding protein n=1 Tax=Roseovarius carneus TaxID=2853164 RepID=UPI0015E82A8E|nr:ATP-binding protein [Roseovarius carneus]MBZ8118485.1 ATP-binding protein [Roseovarius carneus]